MSDYRTVGDPDLGEPAYEPWDGPELSVDDCNTVQAVEWPDDEEYER